MSWGGYGLNLGPSVTAFDAPLFAAVPARMFALGADQFLMCQRDTGRSDVVTTLVAQALQLCDVFAPMQAHVQRICQHLPALQGQESAVRGVLEDLARRGALVRADAWLDALREIPDEEQVPFGSLIIRTAERPETLEALLESLRVQERRWRGGRRCVLVDMSHDPDTVRRNRSALDDYAAATGCSTVHADRTRQRAWLAQLCADVPEHAEGLQYLLGDSGIESGFHGDYGVSLNWITLLGTGERYALIDDDHLFPLRWHPEWTPGIDLADQAEPPLVLAELTHALAWGCDAESDPLLAHTEICGHSLGRLLRSSPTRLEAQQLKGLAPTQLPRFGMHARVLASANGHRGDSCSLSLLWLMALPAAARTSALGDPEFYRRSLQRPAVVQVASRYRRLQAHGLPPFMLDGSQLMPAVPPRGRGEDSVFSALLQAVHRDGLQVELPLSVGHRRPAAPARGDFPNEPATPALAQVLTELLRGIGTELRSTNPLCRLRSISSSLQDRAEVDSAEAARFLQDSLRVQRAHVMAGLRAALQDPPAPPAHWAADLTRLIDVNAHALLETAPARYAEWPQGVDAETGAALWRGYVSRFAAALLGWPEALAVARLRRPEWLGSI